MNRYQTLAANTALISIGTFGSKLLVFLMVRFYTGYLTPAEYGTADLITQTADCFARRCGGGVPLCRRPARAAGRGLHHRCLHYAVRCACS